MTLYWVKEEKDSSQYEYIYEDDEIIKDNMIVDTTIKEGGESATRFSSGAGAPGRV